MRRTRGSVFVVPEDRSLGKPWGQRDRRGHRVEQTIASTQSARAAREQSRTGLHGTPADADAVIVLVARSPVPLQRAMCGGYSRNQEQGDDAMKKPIAKLSLQAVLGLLVVVGVLALGLAVGVAACGSTTNKPTASPTASPTTTEPVAPTVSADNNGNYYALVEDRKAAVAAAHTMQSELGLQLKQLGAPSGSVQVVAFEYGQGTPDFGNNVYALEAGDVVNVSTTVTLCGVKVP